MAEPRRGDDRVGDLAGQQAEGGVELVAGEKAEHVRHR
jgi:hypothetical protein